MSFPFRGMLLEMRVGGIAKWRKHIGLLMNLASWFGADEFNDEILDNTFVWTNRSTLIPVLRAYSRRLLLAYAVHSFLLAQ
jgi:hypothetical protein